MSDLSPLWMAPAVDAVGWDCWPWWSPRTRSHSVIQAMTPWTCIGLSLFPVWPVCHHIASRSQPR